MDIECGAFANASALQKDFLNLFEDRFYNYSRSYKTDSWRRHSQYSNFSDRDIISALLLESNSRIAVSLSNLSDFFVVSIEGESVDESTEIHRRLISSFLKAGVSISSSFIVNELGHIHVYLSFNTSVEFTQIQPIMDSWLEMSGLSGQVSVICPDSPIEIPLQKDFCWLGKNSQVITRRQDISSEASLALFLSSIEKSRMHFEIFQSALSRQTDLLSRQVEIDCDQADQEPELVVKSEITEEESRQKTSAPDLSLETFDSKPEVLDLPIFELQEEIEPTPPLLISEMCLDKVSRQRPKKTGRRKSRRQKRAQTGNQKALSNQLSITFSNSGTSAGRYSESRPPP